jgi:hypothetical protein
MNNTAPSNCLYYFTTGDKKEKGRIRMESCPLEGELLQSNVQLGVFFDKHLIFRRVFFYKETSLFKLTIPYLFLLVFLTFKNGSRSAVNTSFAVYFFTINSLVLNSKWF